MRKVSSRLTVPFARLLAELFVIGITKEQYRELRRGMKLSKNDIDLIFNLAVEMFSDNSKTLDKDSVEMLDLSLRAIDLLQSAGINTLQDLLSKSPSEIRGIKNMGKRSYTEIMEMVKHASKESML